MQCDLVESMQLAIAEVCSGIVGRYLKFITRKVHGTDDEQTSRIFLSYLVLT